MSILMPRWNLMLPDEVRPPALFAEAKRRFVLLVRGRKHAGAPGSP